MGVESQQPWQSFPQIAPNPMGVFEKSSLKRSRSRETSPEAFQGRGKSSCVNKSELGEEDQLLMKLKEEEKLSWNDISTRFRSDLEKSYRVPALQMRYKRLHERTRAWTDTDINALRMAYEYWEKNKLDIISDKMLDFGASERWPAKLCGRKLQEIEPSYDHMASSLTTDFREDPAGGYMPHFLRMDEQKESISNEPAFSADSSFAASRQYFKYDEYPGFGSGAGEGRFTPHSPSQGKKKLSSLERDFAYSDQFSAPGALKSIEGGPPSQSKDKRAMMRKAASMPSAPIRPANFGPMRKPGPRSTEATHEPRPPIGSPSKVSLMSATIQPTVPAHFSAKTNSGYGSTYISQNQQRMREISEKASRLMGRRATPMAEVSPRKQELVTKIANNLFTYVRSEFGDHESFSSACICLPHLLRGFALQSGHDASTGSHGIMESPQNFIYSHAGPITEAFKELWASEENREREIGDLSAVSSRSRVRDWLQDHKASGEDAETSEINRVGRLPSSPKPAVSEEDSSLFNGLISDRVANQWLLKNLHKEILMAPADPDLVGDLRCRIFEFISGGDASNISYISAARTSLGFRLDWHLLAFVQEQNYPGLPHEAIGKAITLTGSVDDAQALTCEQYMQQTWPSSGQYVLSLVKDIMQREGRFSVQSLPNGTRLIGSYDQSSLACRVRGDMQSIAEVGEQLAWLAAALRPSPSQSGVSLCTPSVGTFNRASNPVVVTGFPTPKRSVGIRGLDVPLEMMAALIQTERINLFNESLYLKGFSSMLSLTAQVAEFIMWHLYFHNDGSHVSYLEDDSFCQDQPSTSDLERCRHIVGWLPEAECCAGAANAKYSVFPSTLPEPSPGCVLEKVSISAGKIVAGSGTIARGTRDIPLHVSRTELVPKLQWLHAKYMVLWDEADERGWLVNGTSTLLHLLRASLEHNRSDPFQSAFLFHSENWEEAPVTHTTDSAIGVLLNQSNLELKIYPERSEVWEERQLLLRWRSSEELYSVLEKTIEHQAGINGKAGINLSLDPRKRLEGWEFSDIARSRDPFYPRVAALPTVGNGWINLIQEINAVTLFGRGYGSIIKPAGTSTVCPLWRDLPKHKYYLAACTTDVKQIMEDYRGDPHTNPLKLTRNIDWQIPDCVLDECRCMSTYTMDTGKATCSSALPTIRSLLRLKSFESEAATAEHSEYVQVLLPSKSKPRKSRTNSNLSLPRLDNRGALIFSHNEALSWSKKAPAGYETPITDSGLGSSLHTSQSLSGEVLDPVGSSDVSAALGTESSEATTEESSSQRNPQQSSQTSASLSEERLSNSSRRDSPKRRRVASPAALPSELSFVNHDQLT
ncbi:hypothetical protein EV356DRAFT_579648 [Viridothelium virens]|uniref:Uncharacterized protein n=1 Tax=Viridothelium virens TaxID=1048519 RepID=A0A6A6GYR8_VIRVR|nr:hypothetical protein EV356DRAFT_579648 [Viridothelium virens]